MRRTAIEALASDRSEGGHVLRAPKVGLWSAAPRDGTLLTPGSSLGILAQLSHRYLLLVPEGVSGRVVIEDRFHDVTAVSYGEILLGLAPFQAAAALRKSQAGGSAHEAKGTAVSAPTDGVFYRAPGAGAAPYVSVGDRLVTGQPIGLIEVMKTFNPIVYGGAGYPEDAEIVEILVSDEAEVRAGQNLLIVRKR